MQIYPSSCPFLPPKRKRRLEALTRRCLEFSRVHYRSLIDRCILRRETSSLSLRTADQPDPATLRSQGHRENCQASPGKISTAIPESSRVSRSKRLVFIAGESGVVSKTKLPPRGHASPFALTCSSFRRASSKLLLSRLDSEYYCQGEGFSWLFPPFNCHPCPAMAARFSIDSSNSASRDVSLFPGRLNIYRGREPRTLRSSLPALGAILSLDFYFVRGLLGGSSAPTRISSRLRAAFYTFWGVSSFLGRLSPI